VASDHPRATVSKTEIHYLCWPRIHCSPFVWWMGVSLLPSFLHHLYHHHHHIGNTGDQAGFSARLLRVIIFLLQASDKVKIVKLAMETGGSTVGTNPVAIISKRVSWGKESEGTRSTSGQRCLDRIHLQKVQKLLGRMCAIIPLGRDYAEVPVEFYVLERRGLEHAVLDRLACGPS